MIREDGHCTTVNKLLKTLETPSMLFIAIKPFLLLSVSLRMSLAAENLLRALRFEASRELMYQVLSVPVVPELASMVAYELQ